MSNVQFDEDNSSNRTMLYSRFEAQSETPQMVRWLMKFGVVKSASQANYVLIAIAIIAFGFSIYFFTAPFRGSSWVNSPTGTLSPSFNAGIPR